MKCGGVFMCYFNKKSLYNAINSCFNKILIISIVMLSEVETSTLRFFDCISFRSE